MATNKWPITQAELLTKYPQYIIPDNLKDDAPFFFANAIDKINILTANEITTLFSSLTPTQQESNYRALGELFYFYLNAGANFLRGSLSNSQGNISVSQNFDFPEDIPIKIYQLLELGGVYNQMPSTDISKNNLNYGGATSNNDIISDITKTGYMTKYLADHTYIQNGGIQSKDKSVEITFDPTGNFLKPAFDLSVKATKDPQVEQNKQDIAKNKTGIETNTNNITTKQDKLIILNSSTDKKSNIAFTDDTKKSIYVKTEENLKYPEPSIMTGGNNDNEQHIYVPFDKDTIYYDKGNKVWKAKGGSGGSGIQPSDLDTNSISKDSSGTYKAIALEYQGVGGSNYLKGAEINSELAKKLETKNIKAGTNITLNTTGNDITINATGSGGGGSWKQIIKDQTITPTKSPYQFTYTLPNTLKNGDIFSLTLEDDNGQFTAVIKNIFFITTDFGEQCIGRISNNTNNIGGINMNKINASIEGVSGSPLTIELEPIDFNVKFNTGSASNNAKLNVLRYE